MHIKKKFAVILVASAMLLLSGCSMIIPVNYAPTSTMTASGSTSVAGFKYLPAIAGNVAPNQIRNTAIGSLMFDQSIDAFFRDAVFKELRFVGVKVNDQKRKLSGEIQEFLVDDLGFSIDWTIRVKYVVSDANGVIYESVKETKRNTSKFINVLGSLNETIKLNVEKLLSDPKFAAAIR